MAFVIAEPCIDIRDRSCMDVCPVDCIYEGARKLYIQPDECIDCGACEPECPVDAIAYVDDVLPEFAPHIQDNLLFFQDRLPGRDVPVGSPGGARDVGAIGVDTPMVAAHPAALSASVAPGALKRADGQLDDRGETAREV